MVDNIKRALSELNITRWRINEVKEESAELFFIKHTLDTRRIKATLLPIFITTATPIAIR